VERLIDITVESVIEMRGIRNTCPGPTSTPGFDVISLFRRLHGSSRVFAFIGLHLMPSGTFSATLTTNAFDASRSRWIAARPCRLIPRGHASLSIVVLSSPTPLAAAH
jgi:hypothetical protein